MDDDGALKNHDGAVDEFSLQYLCISFLGTSENLVLHRYNDVPKERLTSSVSAPPTMLSPRPVLPLGISITHS